jgi:hypothetical protein
MFSLSLSLDKFYKVHGTWPSTRFHIEAARTAEKLRWYGPSGAFRDGERDPPEIRIKKHLRIKFTADT